MFSPKIFRFFIGCAFCALSFIVRSVWAKLPELNKRIEKITFRMNERVAQYKNPTDYITI